MTGKRNAVCGGAAAVRKILRSGWCLAAWLMCFSLFVFPAWGQTTEFTYQGRLTEGGATPIGVYLMEFKLFDASTGGAQAGTTISRPSVTVNNGFFTVDVDFGSSAFSGSDLFLEVAVKKNAGDTYTILTPRQQLTSAPYAIRSATAGNAELLGGMVPGTFATTAQLSSQISALQTQNTNLQTQVQQLKTELASTTAGTQLWSKRFGGTSYDWTNSIVLDDSGNFFLIGYFYTSAVFGGGILTSAGNSDIFVGKYSGTTGAHLWSKRFGGSSLDEGYAAAVDANGDIIVTGYFSGTVDFGGGVPLTSAGFGDIFLLKLAGTNGAHVWSKRFGGSSHDFGQSVAISASGDVVLTGYFAGTVDFGGLPLASAGAEDIIVAKYSGSTSSHLWSKRFGGANSDFGEDVALDSMGNVYVSGSFGPGSVDFGGGVLTSAGGTDAFVVKFSQNGTHVWSKRFGGTSTEHGVAIAVEGHGNVVLAGYFYSPTIDLGGGILTTTGSPDVFIAKYDATGDYLWAKLMGGPSTDSVYGLALDANGNVVVCGSFVTGIGFGAVSLNGVGYPDIYIAAFSGGDGTYQWARRFGSTEVESCNAVAVDNSGVYPTGIFYSSTLDLGGGPLDNAGTDTADVFVAKLKK